MMAILMSLYGVKITHLFTTSIEKPEVWKKHKYKYTSKENTRMIKLLIGRIDNGVSLQKKNLSIDE